MMKEDLEFHLYLDESALEDGELARLLHLAYHNLLTSPHAGEKTRKLFLQPELVAAVNETLPPGLAPVNPADGVPLWVDDSWAVKEDPFPTYRPAPMPPPMPAAPGVQEAGEDADFSGGELGQVQLSGRSFRGANFSGCRADYGVFSELEICDCDFSGASLIGARFDSCMIKNCSFSGARLHRSELLLSDFKDCSFEGAVLTQSALLSGFSGGSFLGAKLLGSRFGLESQLPLTEALYTMEMDEEQILWLFCCIYYAMTGSRCAGKILPPLFSSREIEKAVTAGKWATIYYSPQS